jgi:hypothetical protein
MNMKISKRTILPIISLFLVLGLAFPMAIKALTYQELLLSQQDSIKARVLGTMTPSPDINGDGIVNSFDVATLVNHLGENYAPADLNKDGVVNTLDYSILASWWFATR